MPVHDSDFTPADSNPVGMLPALTTASRLVATMLGIAIVIAGLWSALRVFGVIWQMLLRPNPAAGPFQEWTKLFSAPEMQMQVNGAPLSVAPALAVLVLGGGTVILVWLTLGMMLTGAKIITWTTSDREAIQRVLEHAIGPARRRS